MNERVLVTGATGNVGSELVRLLAERGTELMAGTRRPERARALAGDGVEVVEVDYDRTETWDTAAQWAERVFLVAPPFDPRADERLVPFLDWLVQAGCQHVVLLSAMGAGATAATMARVEERIRRTGVPWTFLRPNIYMQNFARGFLRRAIRDDGVFRLPAGDAAVSFVDARDVAAVAAAVLTSNPPGKAIHTLTGPRALTHAEVARTIGEAAGRDVAYQASDDEDLRGILAARGWAEPEAETFVALLASIRAGERTATTPDVERVLGRAPTRFEDWARAHADAWRVTSAAR